MLVSAKKSYVDNPVDKSKLTCLIHENVHFLEKCKVLNDFGTRYDVIIYFNYVGKSLQLLKVQEKAGGKRYKPECS